MAARGPLPLWPWWLWSGSVERRTRCAPRTSGASPLPGPCGWTAVRAVASNAASAHASAERRPPIGGPLDSSIFGHSTKDDAKP